MHYRNELRRTRERIIEAAVRKLEIRQALADRTPPRTTRTPPGEDTRGPSR